MKNIVFIFLSIVLFVACGERNQDQKLTIAVAANAKDAIGEIADSFAIIENIRIDVISGSSGKLTAQIEQAAPFDLFFSADMMYPQYLFNKKEASEPILYARGTLVMVIVNEELIGIQDIDSLLNLSHKIAIANPMNAPYGVAALNFLYKSDSLLFTDKLIRAENISQINHLLLEKAVDIGFTSKSSVFIPEFKNMHWYEVDTSFYQPLNQAFVITNYGNENHSELVTKFVNFINSDIASSIFIKYGYLVNE